MASRALTFVIQTEDAQTLAALARVKAGLKSTGVAAEESGTLMARGGAKVQSYLAGFAAIATGRYLIQQANAAQVAGRQTEAVIKSTGNAAGVSAAQQKELTDRLAQTAGVAPLLVTQGANLERTFTNIKGPALFGRVLADAMDVGAAKSIDLSAAMSKVGRAINDPVNASRLLRSVGISLTSQQKEQVKAMVAVGDTAGAQGVILGELETRFKGSAAAAATDSGKLSAAIQVSAQSIGQDLLPVVHVATGVAEAFAKAPKPVQETVLAMTALAVLGPKLKAGLLGSGPVEALTKYRAATQGVTVAKAELAAATDVATEAEATFDVVATDVAATDGEVTAAATAAAVAQDAQATAAEALTIAEGEAEVASAGLAASLGPIGIAVAGAAAAYALFATSSDGAGASLDRFVAKLKDAKDAELVAAVQGIELLKQAHGTSFTDLIPGFTKAQSSAGQSVKQFEAIGRQNIVTLRAMRAAYAATGGDTSDMDAALKVLNEEAARGADRQNRFGDAVGDAGGKVSAATADIDHMAKALAGIKAVDGAKAMFDLRAAADQAAQGTAQAYTDLAAAQQAAKGNSDEYRAAEQQQITDEKAVASALDDVASAQHDLTEVEHKAVQTKKDLADATLRATISQRDANVALLDAQDKAKAVLADERSTATEKRDAEAQLADAHDNVTLAADATTKAQADQVDASVNGDQAVIDAKQKVVDAEQKVKDAQAQVAADAVAKGKIIADAVGKVKDAQNKVNDALLAQVESNAKLVAAQKGPLAGQEAYAQGLLGIYNSLDPNGPLAVRVGAFLDAINAAIALEGGTPVHTANGTQPGVTPDHPTVVGGQHNPPSGIHGTGSAGATLVESNTSSSTGPKDPARSIHITNISQGTPTQARRASSRAINRELADLVRGRR